MKKLFTAHKILSLIVAAAIMLSGIPLTVFAEDGADAATSGVTQAEYMPSAEEEGRAVATSGTTDEESADEQDNIPLGFSVVAFAPLGGDVANQTVTPDTALDALTLPESLDATVSSGETQTDTSIDGVTWQSEPEFTAITIGELEIIPVGTYVFTPTLPEGYTLADGVSLPAIMVTVEPSAIAPFADATWTNGTSQGAQTITGPATINVTGTVTVTGKLTIEGNVTITGGGTLKRGAGYTNDLIYVQYDASLTLNNITIDGNNSVVTNCTGSLVNVFGSKLNMNTGAKLQNNTMQSSNSGGGVYVSTGTFTMTGGEISGNTAKSGGGVVMVGGTFTMSGGKILGNTATNTGGGVDMNSGTFTMTGGTISGNKVTSNGGGVYNSSISTFTMSGGIISDNTAGNYGGGVYNYGSFTVGGSAKITGNTKSGAANNVYLTDGKYITLGTGANVPVSGMEIGVILVATHSGVIVNGGADSTIKGYFKADDATKVILLDGATLKIVDRPVYVKSDGNDSTGDGTPDNPYATIGKAYEVVLSGGQILVMDDITASALIDLTGTKTVTLKSNGATAQTVKRGATGDLFKVNSGVTLILENITIDGGNTSGISNGGGSLVYVNGGALTMNDGAILQNNTKSYSDGGGVYNGGTFTMNGGEIRGNNATAAAGTGGGVYNGGTFTMNGGEIRGNNATDATATGGGVYNLGTFNMTGGEISDNTASIGGGVRVGGGTFNMTGGTISGNTAYSGGGVINYATFTMNGGEISGNITNGGSGGGVWSNGTFTMTGGEISGNITNGGIGGGVWSNGTFTMSGGTISDNTTATNGGGVYIDNGTFTVGGAAKITGNEKSGTSATPNNVYLNSSTYITLGTPINGMEIGVQTATANNGVIVNGGANESHVPYFKADDTTKKIVLDGDKLKIATVVAVTFSNLTANGTANTVDTTTLTLTFSPGVPGLTDSNITVTGATKGTLTDTSSSAGTTYTLAISGVTVSEGGNVNVAVSNPSGYTITPTSKDVAVHKDTTAPALSGGSVSRASDTAATIGFTTDEAGTAYYLVQTGGTAAPAKPSSPFTAWTTLGPVSGTVSGKAVTLTTGAQDIYVVVVDAAGNVSDLLKITAEAMPTYGITLDKSGTQTFTAATYGYAAQTPLAVAVTNTGNQATGNLTVALSGTNNGSFTLSKTLINSIAVSGSDSFTVVPNTGLSAGTYTATVTVSGSNSITASFNVSFTVNKKDLAISGATITPKTYDGNTTIATGDVTPSFSGNISGDTITYAVSAAAYTDSKNVGTSKPTTFAVTLTGTSLTNYNLTNSPYTGATANITAKTISAISPNDITYSGKAYDGTQNVTAGDVSITLTVANSGIISGDAVTASYSSAAFNDANVGSRSVTFSGLALTGADKDNYSLTSTTATKTGVTISQAAAPATNIPQTLTFTQGTTASQNVNLANLLPALTSPASYGTVTYTAAVSDSSDILSSPSDGTVLSPLSVGVKNTAAALQSATVTVTVSSTNYANFTITITVNVTDKTPTTVTVTAPANITYGEMLGDPSATAAAGGITFTYNYTGTLADGSSTAYNSANKPTEPGNYTVTATLDSATHTGTGTSATFTIAKKTLTWQTGGTANGKNYDGDTTATQNTTPTLNGIINSDTVSVQQGTLSFANANAGTSKAVSASGYGITGTNAWKYNAPSAQPGFGTADISKKSVTITPYALSKTYGEADPTLTYTLSEALIAGNTFSGALSRAAGENVGTYAITIGTLSAGSNYTLTLSATPVNFTINRATYNGTKTASAEVRAGQTTANATLILPPLPAGASYPASGTVGGTTALINSHSISGTTLKFSTASQAASTSATITIPVTNAANYNSYDVVVTITARAATDAEKIADDLDALTFNDIKNQNLTERDITADLALISKGTIFHSDITWASSNTSYIGTDGTVTKPTDSDKTVRLTATVTNDSASGTKVFSLTVKKAPASTGGVGGTVTDDSGQPLDGIKVSVMTGGTNGTLVGTATTANGGIYSFTGLPYGVYSLVVDNGTNTVTRIIIINASNITENVKMPSGNQNTHVEVKGGDTPSVAADNLEDMFTTEDKDAANEPGASVEIKLVVEQVTSPLDANIVLQNMGGKELGFYLDAQLLKTITGTANDVIDAKIQPPPGTKLKIVIDLQQELWGLAPYTIIRVHNGTAATISADYDADLHTLTFEADASVSPSVLLRR